MDKLSELSKPVSEIKCHEDLSLSVVNVREGFSLGRHPVYSQEYVSALLAELEFEKQNNAGVAGMVEDYETKLEAKDERIAELEERENRVVALAGGNAELWETMAARLEAAEAKLATPVRLPQLCGDGDNDSEYTEGLNDGITQSAIYLRRQGFTVEGDE
ncbi:hypothetical protein [Serratia marcescens]|uniref:hypothetical protein n=1 Tax=Serratia marcescens TaxID=615 RepID=UPI0011501FC0|nr:hypothetical protein [Serratia marcescens]QDI41663.1 hypothetical protein FG172_05435 [Serratia marcescens]QDI56094.1 hypothetical protein FG175_05435 [Serratia marcescens]